jgi:hypothetical protein
MALIGVQRQTLWRVLRVEEVKALEREMAALKVRIAELEKLEKAKASRKAAAKKRRKTI